jgi:hypothetical protein
MSSSSELFYLGPLNVDASSAMATLAGSVTNAFSGDATANVDLKLAKFKSLFQFQTDSTEINDVVADDVKFRVVYANAPHSPLGMDIDTSANVVDGAIDGTAGNKNITYDYTRYLALKLFNTHLGVDLFDNEAELRGDLNTSFKSRFNEKLLALAAAGATDSNDTTSPSRLIFNQLIVNKPDRFSNIDENEAAVVDGKHWYKMPGEIGDKFFFLLTVAAAADQQHLTDPLSGVVIPDRIYLICVNIVPNFPLLTTFTYSNGSTLTTNEAILTSSLYLAGGRSASELVSVTVGSLCTSFAVSCFYNCSNLTAINFADSVTSLGNACFQNCSNLTSITIPDSVTTIGSDCFYSCTSLVSVTLPINSNFISLANQCFYNCSKLTSITIPDSVNSLGNRCFFYCTKLTSVTFPMNINFKTLGNRCFESCDGLTSVIIPDSVETLSDGCFINCQELASVTFTANSNLKYLGNACFYSNIRLTSITIPSSVINIQDACFTYCERLSSVTFNDPSNITAAPLSTMIAGIIIPITITFNNTANYAALSQNTNVSSYFTQTPPATWTYIFNA